MKRFFLSLLCFIITFCVGCSASRKHLVPSENYHQLSDKPISVSTRDSISMVQKTEAQKPASKTRWKNILLNKYSFSDDTLYFDVRSYKGSIPVSEINTIEFLGVIDQEIGPVSEDSLSKYRGSSRTATAILFGTIGLIGGFYAGGAITDAVFAEGDDLASVVTGAFIGSIFGVVGGGILGYNLGLDRDNKTAIKRIKQNREQGVSSKK